MAQHRYTAEEIIHRLREAENGRLKRGDASAGFPPVSLGGQLVRTGPPRRGPVGIKESGKIGSRPEAPMGSPLGSLAPTNPWPGPSRCRC